MALLDLLHDREKVAKLIWLGYITSLVFIAIGVFLIMTNLLA